MGTFFLDKASIPTGMTSADTAPGLYPPRGNSRNLQNTDGAILHISIGFYTNPVMAWPADTAYTQAATNGSSG